MKGFRACPKCHRQRCICVTVPVHRAVLLEVFGDYLKLVGVDADRADRIKAAQDAIQALSIGEFVQPAKRPRRPQIMLEIVDRDSNEYGSTVYFFVRYGKERITGLKNDPMMLDPEEFAGLAKRLGAAVVDGNYNEDANATHTQTTS